MGVRGLETFLERQCPKACHKVFIAKLIEKYKQEKMCEKVTIVVDGSSCLRHLYGNLPWIFGCQLKEYIEKVTIFVEGFRKLGVHLIIFFDGASVNRKRPVWLTRRSEDLKKVHEVIDMISQGKILSAESSKRLFLLPGGIGSIARCIFKYVCGCDVRISVRECDEEIAEFAQANQCFAILGQDTDYVIFEGGKHYLSMKNLDMENMTTLCYNRLAFADFICISPSYLPLVASLCGNDVVPPSDLKNFHQRECWFPKSHPPRHQTSHVPFHAMIKGVTTYIKKKCLGRDLYSRLPSIARDVFKDERRALQLETSLKSYTFQPEVQSPIDPQSNWGKILAHSRDRLMRGEIFPYALLSGSGLELCSALEDSRLSDVRSAAELLLPLRQETYGVLMKEKPGGPGMVEEWCVMGEDTKRWHSFVTPAVPSEELHPGLLALWDEERTDIADVRWKLFAHSVGPTLSADLLKQLPQILVIPAAILFYLRAHIPVVAVEDSGYLKDWELKALAVQAVKMETTKLAEIKAIVIKQPYDTRAIRLASIFMRAVTQLLTLLASCGFPFPMEQAMPWHYFDGKVFHQTYTQMKAGSTCEQLCGDKMPLFKQLLDIVLPEQLLDIVLPEQQE